MRPTINNLRGQKKHDIDNVVSEDRKVRKQIKEVPEKLANVEAEKGESVIAPGMGFFGIGGQKHYNGGTHLLLPEGSFVFSDDKDSKITGAVAEMFGKNSEKSYTPAEISKSYELNKYLAILKDPEADHHSKVTAELMIDNNTKKLAELAFMQEGMKGFPDGPPNLEDVKSTMMKKGGFTGIGQTLIDIFEQFDPKKGDVNEPRAAQKAKGLKRGFNKFDAPWLGDFGYDNNLAGFKKAVKSLGYSGSDNVKDMQKFLVEENYKRGNFDLFNSFYKNYGATNQGVSKGLKDFPDQNMSMEDLIKDLVDGNAGVRTGALAKSLLGTPKVGNLIGDKKNLEPMAPTANDLPLVGPIIGNKYDLEMLAPTLNSPANKQAPAINNGIVEKGEKSQPQEIKLGLNTLQKMDLGNSLFDMATVRKGKPTRYQNYGLEQAAGIAANVRPYDYQSIINEVSKQATGAYRANSSLGSPAGARAAANAAIFGQAAEQASKVKMDEYNQNAGLYNTNQQQLGQFASAIGEDKMKNAMLYNDRVELMNDNYDQEVKMLKNQSLSKLNQYMANNQAIMYDNMLHPEFTFDPGSGFAGTMSFNPREDIFGGGTGSTGQGGGNQLENMTAYIQNTFGIKDKEKALGYALQALRSQQPFDDAALGSNMFMNPFLNQFGGRGRVGRGQ